MHEKLRQGIFHFLPDYLFRLHKSAATIFDRKPIDIFWCRHEGMGKRNFHQDAPEVYRSHKNGDKVMRGWILL